MSKEAVGYIQIRNEHGEWKFLPLYKDNNELVSIWGGNALCKPLEDRISGGVALTEEENNYANKIIFNGEAEAETDDICWRSVSLPLLIVEGKKNKILKGVARNICAAIDLAEIYGINADEVRYIYYISY